MTKGIEQNPTNKSSEKSWSGTGVRGADGAIAKFYAAWPSASVLAVGDGRCGRRPPVASSNGGPTSARWNRWTTCRSGCRTR